jgi:hypothetical protein
MSVESKRTRFRPASFTSCFRTPGMRCRKEPPDYHARPIRSNRSMTGPGPYSLNSKLVYRRLRLASLQTLDQRRRRRALQDAGDQDRNALRIRQRTGWWPIASSRHGTFLYDPSETLAKFNHDAAKLVNAVKQAAMRHAWVRLHDVVVPEPFDETHLIVQSLTAADIHVAGWGWVPRSRPRKVRTIACPLPLIVLGLRAIATMP